MYLFPSKDPSNSKIILKLKQNILTLINFNLIIRYTSTSACVLYLFYYLTDIVQNRKLLDLA